MAQITLCELCGRPIEKEQDTATLEFLGEQFDYHAPWCSRKVSRMLEDASRWALGHADATGLVWKLVPADKHPARKRPAVLEPRYRNRIRALCRERKIDRDELAEQLGTSRGAVGRWLQSYTEMPPDRRRETNYVYAHGITPRWMKRLTMFFELDWNGELFDNEPSGDAPDAEFVGVA